MNQDSQSSNLFAKQISFWDFHYYMNSEVGSPQDYVDLLDVLNSASENDSITIHINSPGGRADTTIQLLAAMETCSAEITTILEGSALSAASMIFLKGDKMCVMPHATMMIHSWSGAMYGKSNEVYSHLEHNKKHYPQLMKRVYGDFLTEEEYKSIEQGADLFFDEEEILKRLKENVVNKDYES